MCPRRWKEASGEGGIGRSPGALGGRLGTWEPLASHLSGWCLELGQWKWAPGGREEGQGYVADVAVPLELSSKKRVDYEVVPFQSGIVKRWRGQPGKCQGNLYEPGGGIVPLPPKESSLGPAVRPFVRALRERQGDPGVRQVGPGTAEGTWHRLWHCEEWGKVAVSCQSG